MDSEILIIIALLLINYCTLVSFIYFYCYTVKQNQKMNNRIRSIQTRPLPKIPDETIDEPFYDVLEGNCQCNCPGACSCNNPGLEEHILN